MRTTPIDIVNKKFRRGLRGYRSREVDLYLSRVAQAMEALQADKADLEEELERLRSRLDTYFEMEELLKNSLVNAERAADEKRRLGQREADIIVSEGHQKAKNIVASAQEEADRIRRETSRLKAQRSELTSSLRSQLESQIRMLDEGERQYLVAVAAQASGRVTRAEATLFEEEPADLKSAAESQEYDTVHEEV